MLILLINIEIKVIKESVMPSSRLHVGIEDNHEKPQSMWSPGPHLKTKSSKCEAEKSCRLGCSAHHSVKVIRRGIPSDDVLTQQHVGQISRPSRFHGHQTTLTSLVPFAVVMFTFWRTSHNYYACACLMSYLLWPLIFFYQFTTNWRGVTYWV
jgi:hypothetical protein